MGPFTSFRVTHTLGGTVSAYGHRATRSTIR